MNKKFLIALSLISIASGTAVSVTMALSYYGRACSCPVEIFGTPAEPCCADPSATSLIWQGMLLVVLGLAVLSNLSRIERIYKGRRTSRRF